MAGVALLDVNVLVALFFAQHVHHEAAHDWFAGQRRRGWATCAITENGFVRVASQQPTESGFVRPVEALAHLTRFCSDRHHHRWTELVSLTDDKLFVAAFIPSHRALTGVYLLGLARAMKGRLATFDRTIPIKSVRGASAATLDVIGPVNDPPA